MRICNKTYIAGIPRTAMLNQIGYANSPWAIAKGLGIHFVTGRVATSDAAP